MKLFVNKKSEEKKEEMKYDELNLWELKASIANDWKDDALSQVALYALMTGKIRQD